MALAGGVGMKREWKPGDVARIKGDGMDTVAIRTEGGSWVWVDTRGGNPLYGASFCHESGATTSNRTTRPLVVIDPEDREAVERLAHAYTDDRVNRGVAAIPDLVANRLQAALREFANPTPPKPDEPTGLGAVVEDAKGRRYTRYHATGKTLEPQPWAMEVDDDGVEIRFAYCDVAAVRVLSE